MNENCDSAAPPYLVVGAAVAQLGKFEFNGWLAWASWLLVHLVFLIGFRNKAAVMGQWIYSYFTYKRGSRIVTGIEGAASHQPVSSSAQRAA